MKIDMTVSQYNVIFSFVSTGLQPQVVPTRRESEELEAGEAGPKFRVDTLPDKVDARLLALLTRTVTVLTLVSVDKLYMVCNNLT